MDTITTKEKLSMLRKAKRSLLKAIERGVDRNKELDVVNERINHYVKLEEYEKKLKKSLDK